MTVLRYLGWFALGWAFSLFLLGFFTAVLGVDLVAYPALEPAAMVLSVACGAGFAYGKGKAHPTKGSTP